jgi:type I site-specific restriction endonuclease
MLNDMGAPLNQGLDLHPPAADVEEEDENGNDMVAEVERMIATIQQLMPDAVIEVNGKMMKASEIVAQLQSYLDAVAAANEARRQLDHALLAEKESSEKLEAAIRAHYEATKSSPKN